MPAAKQRLGGLWSCLLLSLLVRPDQANVCDSDLTLGQRLDPSSLSAGASLLTTLEEVEDQEHCWKACCVRADCQLAVMGTECQLFGCLHLGRDVCVLRTDSLFNTYRKKEKDSLVPLAKEPTNDSNNINCRLPMKVGSCRASFPRFYYDVTQQSCRSFIFGGCDANRNNFYTQEECEATCSGVTGSVLPDESSPAPESKNAPMAPGSSRSMAKKDGDEAESSPAEPESTELKVASSPLPEISTDEFAERCEAEPKVGPCKASLMHWYYDKKTRTCQLFLYGGCQGNKNNYFTEESCMAACTVTVLPSFKKAPAETPSQNTQDQVSEDYKVASSPLPEISADEFAERCEAEPKVGPCRASLMHWYYDKKTRTCQVFIYGGCQGNKNNYFTEESCMAACTVTVLPSSKRAPAETPSQNTLSEDYKEQCTVASDPGPCRAAFTMYYFEPSSGTCQSFIYGGCRGNKNRYVTMKECMAHCSDTEGRFEEREHGTAHDKRTPAVLVVGCLGVISALLLITLVVITLRRNKLTRRPSSISDKEELLPDSDEQSSVESLSVLGSPKVAKA